MCKSKLFVATGLSDLIYNNWPIVCNYLQIIVWSVQTHGVNGTPCVVSGTLWPEATVSICKTGEKLFTSMCCNLAPH